MVRVQEVKFAKNRGKRVVGKSQNIANRVFGRIFGPGFGEMEVERVLGYHMQTISSIPEREVSRYNAIRYFMCSRVVGSTAATPVSGQQNNLLYDEVLILAAKLLKQPRTW